MKNSILVIPNSFLVMCLCLTIPFLGTGCDDDDDDYDHNPPENMGSLIVDNQTDNDMAVYIDGFEQDKTDEDDWRAYDLIPGEHRVFLREKGGDRRSDFELDILEGRLTIVDVQGESYGQDRYDYFVRYD